MIRYQDVCIEAAVCCLPDEVVTSIEIERRLAPAYERLRLIEGRLELMSGIRERRFWPRGMLPSEMSIASGEKAIAAAGIDRRDIGLLVHGSVCRDHLEPATASRVHHALDLPPRCLIYDVSNACLGLLDGMMHAANMIELGQTRAALVVGAEDGRHLVEATIDALNADTSLTRDSVKPSVASLTIGSASAAVLLTHRDLSGTHNRLLGGAWRAETAHHRLCHSDGDEAVAAGMRPLMTTDSEELMRRGIEAARSGFDDFLEALGWSAASIDKTFCHQVGGAHRKLMLESLGIDLRKDFATFDFLGNTGSVALPATMAMGIERGHLQGGDKVALLGIGSGINVLMLGVRWQSPPDALDVEAPSMGLSAP